MSEYTEANLDYLGFFDGIDPYEFGQGFDREEPEFDDDSWRDSYRDETSGYDPRDEVER